MQSGATHGGSRARFFVLDGVDGCGKSTQAARLAAELSRLRGRAALHLREPGSTPAGEAIRAIALGRGFELTSAVEALLMTAARAQMLSARVRPALAEGRDVVCERFHPSTYAYQVVAGGLPEREVVQLLASWASDPLPDLTLLLELPAELALARRGAARDRIEDKGVPFQEAVARGYRRYAERRPFGERVASIDASASEAEVFAALWREVQHGA